MNILSLFDGISCAKLALHNLCIPVTRYVASEIDEKAILVAKSNWSDIEHIGSVTNVHVKEGEYDLICAGSPCQGFSFAGKKLNFNDPRSKLFFEFVRILKEGNPKYFFLENNKMNQEHEAIITDILGVSPLKINSALVSAQNRERLYWTNIPNKGIPKDQNIYLNSIIGEYDCIYVVPRGFNTKKYHHYKGKCPCITTSSWEHNFFYMQNGEKKKFTAEQAEEIQGLPIGYTSMLSNSQRFKKIGNGWTIPVIQYLFEGLI